MASAMSRTIDLPFPSRFFRVFFDTDGVRAKTHFERLGRIVLDGVECEVVCPPSPLD